LGHVPVNALLGVACSNEAVAIEVKQQMEAFGVSLKAVAKPGWYF